jgi:hypothetical protein
MAKTPVATLTTLAALAALKKDPTSTAATLADVAADMLAATPGDRALAKRRFVDAVAAQPHLVAQLFTQEEIRARAAERFVEMARQSPVQAGGGGPDGGAGQGHQGSAAPDRIDAEGLGRIAGDGQVSRADRIDTHDDGEGAYSPMPTRPVRFCPPPSSPSPGGGGQTNIADEAMPETPPSARPQPRDIVAARFESKKELTVFDSFTVRDKPIGEILLGDLRGIRARNVHEAAVLKEVEAYVGSAVDYMPKTTVRQAMAGERGEAELKRFIQAGARKADAA